MRVLQLSDRDGNEIVPVGDARATYTSDNVSVEEALNSLDTSVLLILEGINTLLAEL